MRATRRHRCLLQGMAALLMLMAVPATHAEELLVSAAASLSNAFKELGGAFEAQHPAIQVRFNFAASDLLVQQIANGAPVDVLASADQESMDKAATQQLLVTDSRRNFVSNTLVVIVPADSRYGMSQLGDLTQPTFQRITLGNPASVPAGRYAKQALEAAGVWRAIEGKLILAQNVRQSLDYVARGEVDVGLVYGTDALVQAGKVRVLLPVVTASPIRYPIAVTRVSTHVDAAEKFIAWTRSEAGWAILQKYGFLQP